MSRAQLSLFSKSTARRSPVAQGKRHVVAGLFAGIGGVELGLHRAGHRSSLLCEWAPTAQAVLRGHGVFSGIPLASDVRDLRAADLSPETTLIAAGFPCQDLSSVGPKLGLDGVRSSLVVEVFRLIDGFREIHGREVPWLLLENVPFLLDLARGNALALITRELTRRGYSWAYRVLDAEAFGVPQRRRRWFLVASLEGDPRDVLLAGDVVRPEPGDTDDVACGFYWTEGMRALGWGVDAIPPIKGGSTVGVPSPPAIVMPSNGPIVLPSIRDAERFQGFEPDWTLPAETVARRGFRWQLVGNAVCVPVAEWIGARLRSPEAYDPGSDLPMEPLGRWPRAAWAMADGRVYASSVGEHPIWMSHAPLAQFLQFDPMPLSKKAAAGFLKRAKKGSLRFKSGFLERVAEIANRVECDATVQRRGRRPAA